ncbi:DUF2711 family protein [Compostibacter hankyongensis]|uniref:DUF2711 family protein n=1 Tax=Compostibacter hankyongensis TaxID=1007089 RepID=A0ABP8FBF5_9BACT
MITEIDKKLLATELEEPILSFFEGVFTDCFIILHPFYKEVFADHYNELQNYELTYPLIERVTWSQVIKQTGIKNKDRLALTITYPSLNDNFRKMVGSEWNEFHPFLKENHILEPSWAEDKIPEDVLLRFLNFLLEMGHTDIKVGHWPEYMGEEIELVKLTGENKFDLAVKLANRNFVYSLEKDCCLKLPYHDSPYSLLLTNGIAANEIAARLNYEGFKANQETNIYWYIQ